MKNKPKLVLSVTIPYCINFLRGQARYMKAKGFEVYLFCPYGEFVDDFVETEGCKHIDIPYSREISIFKDIKAFFIISYYLLKIKPEIVSAGTPKAGLLCVFSAKILGIKNRIFTLRGLKSTAMPIGFKRSLVERMEKLSGYFSVKIISISPSLTEYAIKNKICNPKKVLVLGKASSNGVDIKRFHPDNVNADATLAYKNKFNIKDSDLILGYVGRIVKSKGIEEYYNAFKILSLKHKNLKFLVVGPKESLSDQPSTKILNQIENDENVIMTGLIKDVQHIYPLMDIFSLPSHNFREGFGNVAIEASASGVPIIVTRGAGCQDAVNDNITGFLVNPKDSEGLKIKMDVYISDKSLREEHGKNGRDYAVNYFANEIIWKGQYELYNSMLR